MEDNGGLSKNGQGYASYFQTLAQQKTIRLPLINSARILFSVGREPMYIKVNKDVNGNIAYAGPNIENPDDANQDVTFDFIELAMLPDDGIYINTSRVDYFGFSLRVRLQAADGYDQQVGELPTVTRAQISPTSAASNHGSFKAWSRRHTASSRLVTAAFVSMRRMAIILTTTSLTCGTSTSYGFAYDDVWQASSSLHHKAPTTATITIGW